MPKSAPSKPKKAANSETKSQSKAPAKTAKPVKLPKKKHLPEGSPELTETAQIVSSDVVYKGPIFRVTKDKIVEPNGKEGVKDVIRHNGSAVILAVDSSKSKKDPWIVIERQYRHAAAQFLWELPAGTLDPGEDPLLGAQRELEEETGYQAKKWKPLVKYFASPGFLGEAMNVFLAEGLVPGQARPEEDEDIEFRLVKLSEIMRMIRKGHVLDGKTLTCVLLYHELLRKKWR
ncbi:NUDIX hydrolase [Occallatibacter riparius]|uniref:GDP-mannose pyrophosphatase n=1 Tax=Occallatibacter riparius TaxID=1002689 RepID=A0A9J7BMR8_9BACT|nr:NUDIX hydrolase [Occallatibacter riparius]UWZ83793.1 NUDIX hydrolase [Occallatibacter riparius]